jgi:[ribosomal protein S5]-alanine N-acetyltransferase
MPNYTIILSKTIEDDLKTLYQIQIDKEANYMAAFTSLESAQENMYIAKYSKFLNEPTINLQTIKVGEQIIGSISKFEMNNENEITYWIDKNFWSKGITSSALALFLQSEYARPIYGRTAFDNIASQKVLEKCGFTKIGTDKGFAHARQIEIEEYIYKLAT